MTKQPLRAALACGCTLSFRDGIGGSPVTVVLQQKSARCTVEGHVAGLPLYDHREALRPSTRHLAPPLADWEES